MKEFLSQNGIEFTFVEITESMANLKAFLQYRDHRPEFAEVRQASRVGIPCVVVNDGEKVILGKPDLADVK
ncbi:MAG: hypothetical protein ACM3XN_00070 [Chloroflexota bacterium]